MGRTEIMKALAEEFRDSDLGKQREVLMQARRLFGAPATYRYFYSHFLNLNPIQVRELLNRNIIEVTND